MTDQPYPPLRPQPPLRGRRRRDPPWLMILGAVLLAVLAVILLVVLLDGGDGEGNAGDGTSPAPSGSGTAVGESGAPSASDAVTAAPTPTPAPTPPPPVVAPPEGILPVGSVVEVTADALRIRQAPATSAPIVTSVSAGEALFLVTNTAALGPVETGGFLWYYVMHAPGFHDWPASPPPEGTVVGWVAAGSADESFLALGAAVCPIGEMSIAVLYTLTPWERLACFGDRPLTLEGTFGCGGCGGLAPGTFQPEWLAHPLNFNVFRPPWSEPITVVETMVLRIAPELPQLGPEQAGSVLRVVAHFNDPRSVDCVIAPGEPGQERPANDLAAEWYCRQQLVVDSWEVIGTDPAYVPG